MNVIIRLLHQHTHASIDAMFDPSGRKCAAGTALPASSSYAYKIAGVKNVLTGERYVYAHMGKALLAEKSSFEKRIRQ